MPAPVLIVATYLAVNFAFVVWLAREETAGREPSSTAVGISRVTRYGPPLLGLGYLVTIAGDWPFFLFVIAFGAVAFWLLDGALNYPSRPPK